MAAGPDSLAALEAHPESVKLKKITDVVNGGVYFQAILCRKKRAACDMFESHGGTDAVSGFADYVYLFAIYRSKFDKKTPAGAAGGSADMAQGLLDEAKAKQSGQAILDYYNAKYPCAGAKNDVKCVLHSLWKDAAMGRFYYRASDDGGYSIQDADEDGETLFSF